MDQDVLPRAAGRTVLRRLSVGDLPAFQAYRRDPQVARYQGWDTMNDDEARSFLADVADCPLLQRGHWSQIAIARETDGALLGDIGLFVSTDETEAEIGISLSREAQGQGMAAEALGEAIRLLFDHTAVKRIVGITDVRNLPSIALLQRVGMRKVGDQESVVKGEACSEFVYAITRAELRWS